jgi:UDP-N-acetylglucosamine 2-epimerase (non-hydrolysing)
MPRTTILSVVGARPNFVKLGPIHAALVRHGLTHHIVHTGQHYDANMSEVFFRDFGLPPPSIHLAIGSGSHAEQTAAAMVGIERAINELHPGIVHVIGDVNSTLAGALAAAKCGIPLAHTEAGVRSFDKSMPEEVNRIVTDRLSDLLLAPTWTAIRNLAAEGCPGRACHMVGNVLVDAIHAKRGPIDAARTWDVLGLGRKAYGVVTMHRPSNVDDPARLAALMAELRTLSSACPLVFPVHGRTRARLASLAGGVEAQCGQRIHVADPLGYVEFLSLLDGARLAVSDSGGLQTEATVLGVPCFTLRDTTEFPETISHGTNHLCGTATDGLAPEILRAIDGGSAIPPSPDTARLPDLWDGHTSDRIARLLAGWPA